MCHGALQLLWAKLLWAEELAKIATATHELQSGTMPHRRCQ
jgi:hypothetical protein